MRICIITFELYPPITRGLEIHVRDLIDILARQGCEIEVIAGMAEDTGFQNANVTLHRILSRNYRKNFFYYFLFFFKTYTKIFTLNKFNKIDVIHLHGSPSFKLFGEFLYKFTNIDRIVYTIHGQGQVCSINKLYFNLLNNIKIIAVSKSVHDFVIKCGASKDKIYIIPSGINLPKNSTEFQIKRDILFVGGLYKEKGVEYLVKAYCKSIHYVKRNKLLIVGDGDLKNYLRNLVKELGLDSYVNFYGSVPHENVIDLMKKALIFVAPSITYSSSIEGTPIVLLEAMSVGLPIITTKVGGIPEIIKDGINGIIVNEKNSDALSKAIIKLLLEPELMSEMSFNNFRDSKIYDWDKISKQIIKTYT